MSETQLSASIRGALEANQFWCVRLGSKGRSGPRSFGTGEPGLPDLLIIGTNFIGFLEVKTDKGTLLPSQVAWHARAKQLGVRVEVVRSVRDALECCIAWRNGK